MRNTINFAFKFVAILATFSAQAEFFQPLRLPAPTPLKLKISTFNIRFYGTGGSLGAPSDAEHRDPVLRSFVADELGDRDVIAFQEIVDVPRLQSNILPPRWSCVSYAHEDQSHQHVVVCARPGLVLEKDPSDDNYIMENVAYAYRRSRPAVHTIVKTNRGRVLARVVAVHLKASPAFSNERQHQARTIGQNLQDLGNNIPTVITGDFNTFNNPENEMAESDESLLSGIFSSFQAGMEQVANSFRYTYRTQRYKNRFDHFWTSGFRVSEALKVFSMCNTERGAGGNTLDDPNYYYENISDHCPVSVTLEQKTDGANNPFFRN